MPRFIVHWRTYALLTRRDNRTSVQKPRRGLRLGLPRNVLVLSWVSFFQDMASELLYPVVPLFLTVTLGAPASVVGLIEGVAEGTAAIGQGVSGRLADRFRRRPLIAAGYGISSAAKPLIGLPPGGPLVLFAGSADPAGQGLGPSPPNHLIA